MTRREFDAATKWSYGAHMAGDTKANYRRARGRIDARYWGDAPRDYIAERAAAHAYANRNAHLDGFLPVLARGSRFRAPQVWRAFNRKPLLRLDGEQS